MSARVSRGSIRSVVTYVHVLFLFLVAIPALAAEDPATPSYKPGNQELRDRWGLERIGWTPEVAQRAKTPVIVAVIDTGLDYYHPALATTRVFWNRKETLNGRDDDGNGYVDDVLGWNFVDGNGNPWDQAGHGTLVAGIIAEIDPQVRVLPLKVLNFLGQGRASRVAEAIYYAVGQGARVINLSLGGSASSQAALRAIEYAERKGVVFVVAAGNDGEAIATKGPAGLPNVITVGATDLEDHRASFSNYGPGVDLVAPGVDVISLRARRTDIAMMAGLKDYKPGANFVGPQARYYRGSGTSFAAPFVSGTAALILSQRPELDPAAVKRMIVHSARDVGAPGVDSETGYGLLDVKAALAADPRYFVAARIAGIAVDRSGGAPVVRVTGTADADQLQGAWVELGQGEAPASWQRISGPHTAPVRAAALADVPASALAGAAVWTLRLVVQHANGTRRETRHVLRLG